VQINPYLHFDGRREEAFDFYAQCLGGKIEFMMMLVDQFGVPWMINCEPAA
jgi:uncharacterized glyoxalase superfamily protein PhnB